MTLWPLIDSEYEYGCVKCQKWHGESDGPIYQEHIMRQSKHGLRRRAVPAENPPAHDSEGITGLFWDNLGSGGSE